MLHAISLSLLLYSHFLHHKPSKSKYTFFSHFQYFLNLSILSFPTFNIFPPLNLPLKGSPPIYGHLGILLHPPPLSWSPHCTLLIFGVKSIRKILNSLFCHFYPHSSPATLYVSLASLTCLAPPSSLLHPLLSFHTLWSLPNNLPYNLHVNVIHFTSLPSSPTLISPPPCLSLGAYSPLQTPPQLTTIATPFSYSSTLPHPLLSPQQLHIHDSFIYFFPSLFNHPTKLSPLRPKETQSLSCFKQQCTLPD